MLPALRSKPCDYILMNDDGRVIVQNEEIVHGKPPCAPIPISKWVNIFKFGMEVSRSSQCILFGYVLQLTKRFAKFFLYVSVRRLLRSFRLQSRGVCKYRDVHKLPSARIVGVLGE